MDINLWHRRCAHHSHATITKLIQGDLVVGLVVSSKNQPDPICEACLAGKMTSGPFPSSDSISEHPLELVHSDLHGPLPVASPEGYRYWMTFIDDCTKLQAVMYLRRKSDAFEAFKRSRRMLRTSSMRKSRLYRMTRLVNTCQLLSTSSWISVALLGATAPGIGLSRTEWQSEQTAPFLTMLLPC